MCHFTNNLNFFFFSTTSQRCHQSECVYHLVSVILWNDEKTNKRGRQVAFVAGKWKPFYMKKVEHSLHSNVATERSYYWCYRNPPQTTTEIGRLWSNEGYFGGTVMPCDMGTWNCQRLITNTCELCSDSLTDFWPPMKYLGVDWDDNFDADKRSENINQFTNMPHTGSGDMRSHFSQNLTFREKTSTFWEHCFRIMLWEGKFRQ